MGRQTISEGSADITLPPLSGPYIIMINNDMVKVVVK